MNKLQGLLLVAVVSVNASVAAYAAGSSPLIEAVKNKDKAAVKTLLAQKADAKATETDGTTALHWAAHWNDLEITNALLAAGADPKAINRYGTTPLAEAANSSSGGAVVERLLKAGADANTLTTEEGETVLMTAARSGNAEAVKILLDHGANPNAKESYKGQTALMWAASEGHADVIKLLLAKGADSKMSSDDRDTTPPKLTAGSPVAPVSRGGLTALIFAARQGQIEAADALLTATDINQTDVDGNSALVVAIMNKHYDFAKHMIERGEDVNLANKKGRTPLYMAVDIRNEDYSTRPPQHDNDKTTAMDVIQSLLAKGANVNAQLTAAVPLDKAAQDHGDKTLSEGATPFMRAARSADLETMKLLLAKGADPKLANKDGLTALLVAAGVSYSDKIRGTDAEALQAVKICVEHGLDVNAVTDRGETALHGAALRGATSIISYLVEKGAKLDAKNKQGYTPLDIANGKGALGGGTREPNEKAVALLKDLMAKGASPTAQNIQPK